ncbi:MAG: thioredoxin domain-containing protein [Verrucomicrobia bacterium]|nr:thioredoxin domain-containing protein [Verrucomicrobiota bacterium]
MSNALAAEKSPYLLQHADNPVAWLPWGEAAFAQARAEDKPVFLSIGYSTCHWCHVMAHESFESPEVAAILNAHFVAIKVDREERPDVDKVYMAYVQALTGHGGWPLSAWLTPELKPFYGGTYFPPEDRHGRPGFPAILQAIAAGWQNERDKLVAESERVLGTLREYHSGRRAEPETGETPPLAVAAGEAYEKCFQYFYEAFDAAHGGFGGAPKFPRASNLNFLFRVAAIQGVASETGAEAVRLAASTLRAMARGGIHDQVGGGYHRYSVDETWFVPHFEKMLYDQAQIAINCLEARQATGDERFAWMARDIFDYVQRDLTGPAGGFFTAEDADSPVHGEDATAGHGHGQAEGAFYVWSATELRALLGDDAPFVAAHFVVLDAGHVGGQLDPHGEFRGKNILAQRSSLLDPAKRFSLTPEQANDRLMGALEKLRAARATRPRPLLDDKVVTANNGLMISALARGAAVPAEALADQQAGYLAAAVCAAEFVQRELYDAGRGVLFRCWRKGRGLNEGFAEDYAYFIQGLLDLYEASFDLRWLQWAEALQTKMDRLFWDEARGGYFNSAAGDAAIVLRLREDYDGAEPAPSSVAAMNLLRLAVIFHDDTQRGRGVRCVEAFRAQWSTTPHGMPQMLCALELALEAPRQVVLVGDGGSADFRALVAVAHEGLGPRRALLAVADDAQRTWWAARAPWMAGMFPLDGRATAYVCEDYACRAPVTTVTELRSLLGGK